LSVAAASVLAQGIYLTVPPAPHPLAAAIDDLAKKCAATSAELRTAIGTFDRPVNYAKRPLPSAKGGKAGQFVAVDVAAPKAQPPTVLACLAAPAPRPKILLDVLLTGNDLGPGEMPRVDSSGAGKAVLAANEHFGDSTRQPWRLPTTIELLAILQVFLDQSVWGPNGGLYWTGDGLANGSGLVVEARTENQALRAALTTPPSAGKATPVFVRSR
jgi:hypothetical protein